MSKSVTLALVAAALAAGPWEGARAATAHNSQAGSWGPVSEDCAPTPYFPGGGCLSSALAEEGRSVLRAPSLHNPGPRLTAPRSPAPPPIR